MEKGDGHAVPPTHPWGRGQLFAVGEGIAIFLWVYILLNQPHSGGRAHIQEYLGQYELILMIFFVCVLLGTSKKGKSG